MSITDVVGNMLTIIRNGNTNGFADVSVPYSKMSEAVVNVLVKEGFVAGAEKITPEGSKFSKLKIALKYGPSGKKVINNLERVSRPGRRIYFAKNEIPRLKNGYGTIILTTSKGILSGKEARLQNVGGEVLCKVW